MDIVRSDEAEERDERISNWITEVGTLRRDLGRAIQREDSNEINRLIFHIRRVDEALGRGSR